MQRYALLLALLSVMSTRASVTVCAKSATLFKCDGVTPYNWDAFPYIRFNGRLTYVCDGDPLLPVADSYVRYDNPTPTWNMCCEWAGAKDLFTSFDVQILDRETMKNVELGRKKYSTLPESGTTLELQMDLESNTVLGKLELGIFRQMGKHEGLYSPTGGCHYGTANLTVSVDWPVADKMMVDEAEPPSISRGKQPLLLAAAVLGIGATVALAANLAATRLRAML